MAGQNQNQQKKSNPIIIIAIVLFFISIRLFVLFVIGVSFYVLIKKNSTVKSDSGTNYSSFTTSSPNSDTPRNTAPKNDCPNTFCFHQDKAVHHVYKGKEVDPWDRPDTDISKYQRK